MKVHNAWQIEFKQDIPIQVFSLFLKAVQKARSAFGLSYTETKKNNFALVHREEVSHQGLVRLGPNLSVKPC